MKPKDFKEKMNNNFFITSIDISHSQKEITYQDNIITLGSCFSENIGQKLIENCFSVEMNPFGVLYNPFSISNSLEMLLEKKQFTQNDIFQYRSLWHSFSHSSYFSDISSEKCLMKIQTRLDSASEFLRHANFLLITFGTAWIYEERKSGRIVANCHKLPSSAFLRRRLTVEEIVANYDDLIKKLQSLFPQLYIIFSISPIRYWKDGAHENNVSKSVLFLAIDALQKKFENVTYFPAYEILMDELRDYRFYDEDMIHPSAFAIKYIWKKFSDTYFSEITQIIVQRVEQLLNDFKHKPMHPESEEYKEFLLHIQHREEQLLSDFPFLAERLQKLSLL